MLGFGSVKQVNLWLGPKRIQVFNYAVDQKLRRDAYTKTRFDTKFILKYGGTVLVSFHDTR